MLPRQLRRAAVPIAATGEPDLRSLGRVLWAKKTKILGITLLAAAAASAVVNTITPRYRSESRLLLETHENVFLRAEADKNGGDRNGLDPEAVTSQTQLVLSRDLAREVIKKEKLANLPEFDPAMGRVSVWKSILGMFGIGRRPGHVARKSVRWNPITTGSTSMRWKNPASLASISIRPIPISPPRSPTASPRLI